MEATLLLSIFHLLLALVLITNSISAVPVPLRGDNEAGNSTYRGDFDLSFRVCAECDYFLNGCPLPDGIFGVNCPQNGEETCGMCLDLQGITTEASNVDPNHQPAENEKVHASSGQRLKRSCLHYGNICSGKVCCANEGLRCQTNSEGRGRNHLVCAYD